LAAAARDSGAYRTDCCKWLAHASGMRLATDALIGEPSMPIPWDLIASIVDAHTLAAAVVIALVVACFAARRTRLAAIRMAQFVAFVALAFAMVGAGRVGYLIGVDFGQANSFNHVGQLYFGAAGAAIGGIAGLAASALVLSPFFVLFEIVAGNRK
jgi:hypothetical protein